MQCTGWFFLALAWSLVLWCLVAADHMRRSPRPPTPSPTQASTRVPFEAPTARVHGHSDSLANADGIARPTSTPTPRLHPRQRRFRPPLPLLTSTSTIPSPLPVTPTERLTPIPPTATTCSLGDCNPTATDGHGTCSPSLPPGGPATAGSIQPLSRVSQGASLHCRTHYRRCGQSTGRCAARVLQRMVPLPCCGQQGRRRVRLSHHPGQYHLVRGCPQPGDQPLSPEVPVPSIFSSPVATSSTGSV